MFVAAAVAAVSASAAAATAEMRRGGRADVVAGGAAAALAAVATGRGHVSLGDVRALAYESITSSLSLDSKVQQIREEPIK